jgi:heme exporter protein C
MSTSKSKFHQLYRYASLPTFYRRSRRCIPYLITLTLILFAVGIYGAVIAPKDAVQGQTFRLIYVHVPAALLSLGCYAGLAICSFSFIIWRVKLADIMASVCGYLGCLFTLLALLTGSIWGKPMWGAWWIWDARLTSELILLFIYLAYLLLRHALISQNQPVRPAALLAIIGAIDLPIIHYSVLWWTTLHQGPTLLQLHHPTIATSMLWPLLCLIAAYSLYFILMLLLFTRWQILTKEQNKTWVLNHFSTR